MGFFSFCEATMVGTINQWWQIAQKNGDHDDPGPCDHEHHKNQETIGTPISNERSSRSQGTMGTPERPEVKTAFYSQISQAWQGPVKTSAFTTARAPSPLTGVQGKT